VAGVAVLGERGLLIPAGVALLRST